MAMNETDCCVRIHHNGLGSADFVTDVLLQQNDHPKKRQVTLDPYDDFTSVYENYYGPPPVGPSFMVVEAKMQRRMYSDNLKADVFVCKLVLMDGSGTLFKAATSSTMSRDLNSNFLSPGSLICVLKYDLLWLKSFATYEFRFVMLIKLMSSRSPPLSHKEHSIVLKRAEIELVDREGLVVFTALVGSAGKERFHVVCSWNQLLHGDWITEPSSICDWQDFMGPRVRPHVSPLFLKRNYYCPVPPPINWDGFPKAYDIPGPCVKCRCVTELCFARCICEFLPVSSLDIEEIFKSCVNRLQYEWNVRYHRMTWEELIPKSKRWCIYWYYSTNVYQVRSEWRRLPPCVVDAVRVAYPNPKIDFFVTPEKGAFLKFLREEQEKAFKLPFFTRTPCDLSTASTVPVDYTPDCSVSPAFAFAAAEDDEEAVPADGRATPDVTPVRDAVSADPQFAWFGVPPSKEN
jgi:hypothetical protein